MTRTGDARIDHTGGSVQRPSGWSREEIERFIATERLAYQKIRLPYGLATPGTERPEVCEIAFGESVKGKSVFDVGSYLGYFCLEALDRGAAEAVGIEVDPDRVSVAKVLADIKGLQPTYQQDDIESYQTNRRFDIVLCLNVLHHVFDPIAVLHKLSRMTNERLILEVATFGEHDSSKIGLRGRVQRVLSRLPVLYVGPGAAVTQQPLLSQKFFLSREAILNILESHLKVFSKVEIIPSTFKGRFIVRATRRRIGHLLIVSGPTSSGKSTFLRHLKDGTLAPDVRDKLPANCVKWPQIGASALFQRPLRANDGSRMDQAHLEGLVLHYDFLRPRSCGTHNYDRDQSLDLLSCAEHVTVVVLQPSVDQLIKQLIENEMGGRREPRAASARPSFSKRVVDSAVSLMPRAVLTPLKRFTTLRSFYTAVSGGKHRSYYEELLECYERDGWLRDWYDRWFRYLTTRHPSAQVVNVVMPVEGEV